MTEPAETPLTGGNVTTGLVRIGDTVRRPPTPHTASTTALLHHFSNAGLSFTPRLLGTDEKGRTILSYLPGTTDSPPDLWTSPRALTTAAQLLRRLHDASTTFQPPSGATWAYLHPDPDQREVICHNDFAPYNLLFEHGLPTGVIDWDLAGPGPRLRDLAYLAYWLVPLSFGGGDMTPGSETDAANGHPRLHAICAAYGTDDIAGLLDMVGKVLAHMASQSAAAAMIGPQAAQRLANGGHFAHWQGELEAFENRTQVFSGLH